MQTFSFVQEGDVLSRYESIKPKARLGNFIPPMFIISGLVIFLITLVVAALYFIQSVAVLLILTATFAVHKYVKRSHLTFFQDGYSHEVFTDDADGVCN